MKPEKKKLSTRKYTVILILVLLIILLKTFLPPLEAATPDAGQEHHTASGEAYDNRIPFDTAASFGKYLVHVLDVGQGLSILVQHGDKSLLYDGGEKSASAYVVSYLKHLGISKLDYCISSHYDSDHLYGVVAAMNAFEIDTLIGADYATDSPAYDAFQEACSDWKLSVTHPKSGDSFAFGDGYFQVFHSTSNKHEDENDYSLMVRLTLGECSLLMTGDASIHIEWELLKTDYPLDSDVLVAGHHGSSDSTSKPFWEKVSPEYTIISCGLFNDHGHPHWETVELLEAEQANLYRTDLQDTIIFTMTKESITFEQSPCGDYTSGTDLIGMRETVPADVSFDPEGAEEAMIYAGVDEFNSVPFDPTGFTYILNTGGKKFHTPDCEGIYEMKAKNRQGTLKSRDELINAGYKGCGTCSP